MSIKLNIQVNVNDLGIMEEDLNLELYRSYIMNKIDSVIKEKLKKILEIDYWGNISNEELNKYINEKISQLLKEQDIALLIEHSTKKNLSNNLVKAVEKRATQKNLEKLLKDTIDEELKNKYKLYIKDSLDEEKLKEDIKKKINKVIEKRIDNMILK